jgi:hypothetical protein
MRIERRHRIELALPIAAAFPLFTPKGEIAWAPGWAPEWLHPADGETCEGMVFRTFHDDETTLWGCVVWRPEIHHVRYARVTPASRFAFVDIRCRALGPERTEVEVGYDQTALAAAGEATLAALDPATFAATIDGWRREIDAVFPGAAA